MLRFLRITIRNFLSVGNVTQTIDFAIDGLTLVLGENADIGGANSRNGVGKTTIIQALFYVLYGKPLTKIRVDNLVNNINSKDMLVTIDFEVGGKPHRIERGRKPNLLRFFKDGVQLKDEAQGENKHTQAEIERIISVSHTMFKHIVALNTSTQPFLREESAVQREVIEELFGITQLSQRADALKKLIDLTKDELRDAEATVKANTEANTRVGTAIERATAEGAAWQTVQDRKLATLMAEVEKLFEIDIDHEIAVFDQIDAWQEEKRNRDARRRTTEEKVTTLTQEIVRLRKDIERYTAEADATSDAEVTRLERQAQLYLSATDQNLQPIARLQADIARRRKDIASKRAEAAHLATDLSAVVAQIASPDAHRCSTCGQGLAGTDHLQTVLTNLKRQEQTLESKIGALVDDEDRATADIAAADAEIEALREADRRYHAEMKVKAAAIQDEIALVTQSQEAKRAAAVQQATELRQTLARITEERQEAQDWLAVPSDLGPAPVSAYKSRDAVYQVRQERDRLYHQLETESEKPNPHDAKVDTLRSTLVTIDYDQVNELTSRFKHESFLHKLLTAKDSFIRKQIIDQNLSYLNRRLDHYLQRLALPHEVAFKPDLSVEISMLGASFDYEQLSRGEMNRVNLSASWSFRDCWQNLNMPVNLMLVDECLDQGTDGAGVEAAIDILMEMASGRSLFLISHREELRDRIDNVMVVRKENQFTTFV